MEINNIKREISKEFLGIHLKKYNEYLLKEKLFNNVDDFKESIINESKNKKSNNEESKNNLELVSINDIETSFDGDDGNTKIDMDDVINNMIIENIKKLKYIKYCKLRYLILFGINIYYIIKFSNINFDKMQRFLDENSDFNNITIIVLNLVLPIIFFNIVMMNHYQIINGFRKNIKNYGFQYSIENSSIHFVKSCIPNFILKKERYSNDEDYFRARESFRNEYKKIKKEKIYNIGNSTGIHNLSEFDNFLFNYLRSEKVIFNIFAFGILYLITTPYFALNDYLLKDNDDNSKGILSVIEESVYLFVFNILLLLFNHNVKNKFDIKRIVYISCCVILVLSYLIIVEFNFKHLLFLNSIEYMLIMLFLFGLPLMIINPGCESYELKFYHEIYHETPSWILCYLIEQELTDKHYISMFGSGIYSYVTRNEEQIKKSEEKLKEEEEKRKYWDEQKKFKKKQLCSLWFKYVKIRLLFFIMFYIISIPMLVFCIINFNKSHTYTTLTIILYCAITGIVPLLICCFISNVKYTKYYEDIENFTRWKSDNIFKLKNKDNLSENEIKKLQKEIKFYDKKIKEIEKSISIYQKIKFCLII